MRDSSLRSRMTWYADFYRNDGLSKLTKNPFIFTFHRIFSRFLIKNLQKTYLLPNFAYIKYGMHMAIIACGAFRFKVVLISNL